MKFQIISISLKNRKFELSYNNENNDNTYTIITGKNGLGKTRLLNFIIYQYIKETHRKLYYYNRSSMSDFKNLGHCDFKTIGEPAKIIVHTNSKFDKFPHDNEANLKKYININNISGYRDSDGIFYKILLKKNINYKSVKDTLSYLNYDSKIKFELSIVSTSTPAGYLDLTVKKYEEILNSINFDIKTSTKKLPRSSKKFLNLLFYIHERSIETPTPNELLIIYNLFLRSFIYDYFNHITIDLNEDKIDYGVFNKNEFLILIKYKLINIHSIYLQNLNSHSDFFNTTEEFVSFYDLSSGQKSIINTLLGISSVIEDNSLICIDEPEISLHPEWQEEIIQKLQEVFMDKQGCHFLIATHSPQVVSGLNTENGFILDLERGELLNNKEFSKKSADYQLAKIFNSPGYNNEYIIKNCLFLLSKIQDKSIFNDEDLTNLNELKSFKSSMKLDDPVYYLVKEVISLSEVNQ